MASTRCNAKDVLRRKIPIVAWLPEYSWTKLFQDSLAGLTVGLTAIPQGIAYAIVAGLPPQVTTTKIYITFLEQFPIRIFATFTHLYFLFSMDCTAVSWEVLFMSFLVAQKM